MKKKPAARKPVVKKRKPKTVSMKTLPPIQIPQEVVTAIITQAINDLASLGARRLAASALLMREVVCERIYRRRDEWDHEHPNFSLGVREIRPGDIAAAAVGAVVDLPASSLKDLAAEILDEPDTDAWPAVVTRFLERDA